MKETIGILLSASVLTAGCAAQEAAPPPPPPTVIKVESLPGELPAAVADQLQNVVAIEGIRAKTQDRKHNQTARFCSGVRIANLEFLSESSCDWDLSAVDQIPYCDAMGVGIAIPGDEPKGVTYPVKQRSGVELLHQDANDDSLFVEIAPEKSKKAPDYAKPTHFAPSPVTITPGTPLFLANYQTTDKEAIRSPDPDLIPKDSKLKGPNKPVVMGAVALNQLPGGVFSVLVDMKQYDGTDETALRVGDNGGPVYDAKGNLVGLETNSTDPQSVLKLEKQLNYSFPDVPINANVQVAIVQPVNPKHIDELRAKKQLPQSC
jgi:hypothetical protein